VVHICNPIYSGGGDRRSSSVRPDQAKLVRPCLKSKIKTKGLGVQLKWYSKYKALGAIPSTTKKKKKKRERQNKQTKKTPDDEDLCMLGSNISSWLLSVGKHSRPLEPRVMVPGRLMLGRICECPGCRVQCCVVDA
jgi:hypothetical protein